LQFFAVPVSGSWILKFSGTGPVCGPSKKGNRTGTGPDFKALRRTRTAVLAEPVLVLVRSSVLCGPKDWTFKH
jgi:hypothetical protein